MGFYTISHNHGEFMEGLYQTEEEAGNSIFPTLVEEFGEEEIYSLIENEEIQKWEVTQYVDTAYEIKEIIVSYESIFTINDRVTGGLKRIMGGKML